MSEERCCVSSSETCLNLALKMSYTSKLPASWNDGPPPRKVEIDLSSPGLAVFELERLLFTGKAIISHADEVWPGLYIGDQ